MPTPSRRARIRLTVVVLALLLAGTGASGQALPTSLPETIPIFPLEDAMLFPEMAVPLRIFEPRYRAMVADALKGNRIIGMVQLRPGYEADYERSPSIFPFGVAGVITEVETLPNGEYTLVLQAFAKFRVTREEASRPYRIAHVTAVSEAVPDRDRPALMAERERLASLLARVGGRLGFRKIPDGITDEQFVNGVSQYVFIDPIDRERLLEQDTVLGRARLLYELLEKEAAAP